jgi:hypothetical protein
LHYSLDVVPKIILLTSPVTAIETIICNYYQVQGDVVPKDGIAIVAAVEGKVMILLPKLVVQVVPLTPALPNNLNKASYILRSQTHAAKKYNEMVW